MFAKQTFPLAPERADCSVGAFLPLVAEAHRTGSWAGVLPLQRMHRVGRDGKDAIVEQRVDDPGPGRADALASPAG